MRNEILLVKEVRWSKEAFINVSRGRKGILKRKKTSE